MEEAFRKVVENIFNNWTVLILAVENGMAGSNSDQTINDCLNYMVQYCLYGSNVNIFGITEALEDILDQEFDTICEDESPKQVATILYKFLCLLKENNLTQFEAEFNNLPTNKMKLSKSKPIVDHSEASTSQEELMEDEDSNTKSEIVNEEQGWTKVKTRRKR